ncbi:hypothetical protein [Enterococcus thailandicus]|uniref:hypothetical protein n=1 Tax=Enterococcus thailandicus TaxID=417368 RepID=UPI00244D94B7|nr:hypothetical protein [Enterococcus thailandicus]GMC00196.1 hypothetical protein K2F_04550 [Enterococcus thailandicus]
MDERILIALESIANSLSTLAEDTKAKKQLNIEIHNRLEKLEGVLLDLKDDPFGLNKRD